MSSSSSADRVNSPLARSIRRATSVGGPTIPRATTPRRPTVVDGRRDRERRLQVVRGVVVVDDARRPRSRRLRGAEQGGDPGLLRVDRERVRPHELVEPRPQRQPVAQAAGERLEQVAVAVDEPRDDRPARAVDPAGGAPAGQLVGRAHGDDAVAVDGDGTRLDDPPLVVDGDDRAADEQQVAAGLDRDHPLWTTGAHYMQRRSRPAVHIACNVGRWLRWRGRSRAPDSRSCSPGDPHAAPDDAGPRRSS